MNHKHEAPWLLKKCTLYTLCTLILSNPLHLTIGSNLIKWFKMSFEFQNFVMHILKFYFLMFRILIKCHQDFSLTHTYHAYTFFGWKVVKNGSPIVWFHPILINFAKLVSCFQNISPPFDIGYIYEGNFRPILFDLDNFFYMCSQLVLNHLWDDGCWC